jgi:sulfur-oxidizing protein SoxX
MKRNAMRLTAIGLVLGLSTFAYGAEVAPSDVKFDNGAVAESLTGAPGDAAEGRKAVVNRRQGNCVACHVISKESDQAFQGEIGPPLDGVAGRWTEAELRGILTNSKKTFDGTIMPAFYSTENINRPLPDFAGKTILTAQQVEDVVAYLMTLTE